MYKSGFVTLLGPTNVGKSTLLNAIIGKNIASTLSKVQTTRNSLHGIYHQESGQIVFVDTPGLHFAKDELGKKMNKVAWENTAGVDLVLIMIDPRRDSELEQIISRLNKDIPTFLLINKIDLYDKKVLFDYVDKIKDIYPFAEIFPLSSLKKLNVDQLITTIFKYLPEGPPYYPSDTITNRDEDFLIEESIRKVAMLYAKEEIPYAINVEIKKKSVGKYLYIDAAIIVDKHSRKGILIGTEGLMIKKIKERAQKEIYLKLGKKVKLDLVVEVEKNWRNKSQKFINWS